MKRIAIFTVSIGEGHHQASLALKEEWKKQGYEPEIIDVMSYLGRVASIGIKDTYYRCIRSAPFLWDWIYKLTDIKFSSYLVQPLIVLFWEKLFTYCEKRTFDVMIGTHPLATQLCLSMKKRMKKEQPDLKVFSVLTDFNTHCLSISKQVDAIFIAEENEKKRLMNLYPSCQFYDYGIPTRMVWDVSGEMKILRKRLSIPVDEQVIVISGGGEGLLPEKEVLSLLEHDTEPSYIIWFQGKGGDGNKGVSYLRNGSKVNFMSFSTSFSEYVKAADFFISKPGGVSMAEALLWQIPTGIMSPLPGQEKMNQSILSRYESITILQEGMRLSEVIKGLAEKKKTWGVKSDVVPTRQKIVDTMIMCCQKESILQKQGSSAKKTYGLKKSEWNT